MTGSLMAQRFTHALAALAVAAVLGAAPGPAVAAGPPVKAITATLNGNPLAMTPPARVVDGRLYLPLRPIIEALQIRVSAKHGVVQLHFSDRTLKLEVGDDTLVSVGGSGRVTRIPLGSPVLRIDGTTFVPLRFVSEGLGAQVAYDGGVRRVAIVSMFAGAAQAPPTSGGAAAGATRVSGTVTAVDRFSQPPTITVLQNNVPQTISMTSQAKVVLQDVSVHTTFAGSLADIQPGDELAATIDSSGDVIQVVDFFSSHSGTVAAVSGGTFVLKDGRVVTPPPTGTVTLNGVAAQVSDLRVGDHVTVRVNPETNEVRTVIASRPSTGTPPPAGAVDITAFSIRPTHPLRAGDTLRVSMVGTPGGSASFDLGPIIKGLPMTEGPPGHYHGSLPITDGINLTDISVFGNLVVNGMAAPRAEAQSQLSVATTPPQIAHVAPLAGETVNNDRPNIFATFSSPTQIGIDPASIRLTVDGQDVSSLATRNASFVVYTPPEPIPPGKVDVSVSVADMAGNVVSRNWSFTIGTPQ